MHYLFITQTIKLKITIIRKKTIDDLA